jgi:hypothetical protein
MPKTGPIRNTMRERRNHKVTVASGWVEIFSFGPQHGKRNRMGKVSIGHHGGQRKED